MVLYCVYPAVFRVSWAWPTANPLGAWLRLSQTRPTPPPHLKILTIQPTTNKFIIVKQARELGRCDSYLRNLKLSMTDSLTHSLTAIGGIGIGIGGRI